MHIIKSSSDLANIIKQLRRAAKLKQCDFAKKLNISCEELIQMERGNEVGIQVILSALNAMGLQLKIEDAVPDNGQVISNFNDYYQERFRSKLEARARSEPSKQGFLSYTDHERISIVNLKKAFDI